MCTDKKEHNCHDTLAQFHAVVRTCVAANVHNCHVDILNFY